MRKDMIENLTRAYLQGNEKDIENFEAILYDDEINEARNQAKKQGWLEKKYEDYIAQTVKNTANKAGDFLINKNYRLTGDKIIKSGKNIADRIANSNLEDKIDKGVDKAKDLTKKASKSLKKGLNKISRWLDDKTKE